MSSGFFRRYFYKADNLMKMVYVFNIIHLPLIAGLFLLPECYSDSKAKAEVVSIGSLNASSTLVQPTGAASYASPVWGIAQSFWSSTAFTLNSVRFNLFNTSATNTGTWELNLYSGTLPGSKITLGTGDWALMHSTNSANIISFSGLSNNLLANTTYWIGVENTGTNSGSARQWAYQDTNLFGNNTAASNYAFLSGANLAASTWASQGTGHALGLEITGATAVPEPGTWILGGISSAFGCAVVWWCRQKRYRVSLTRSAP